MAHWMQPPAQYEPSGAVVNSFDAVFYESVPEGLSKRLEDDGFGAVSLQGMATEEYEQFEVLEERARKAGRAVDRRPAELWRLDIVDGRTRGRDWERLTGRVARGLGDEVWGDNPGWFSRAYCQEMDRQWGAKIWPDKTGLRTLAEQIFDDDRDGEGVRWVDGITFQILCDFLGVVLQSETNLTVQWGTCPVDEDTGLAPAPLLRARAPRGRWDSLPVGQDVMRRLSVDWAGDEESTVGERLASLVDDYEGRAGVIDGQMP